MDSIKKRLWKLQDFEYKDFQSSLMPNIEKKRIIGVRTPDLRKLAKELADSWEAVIFLKELPHTYYEENNLHGFLIECMGKNYDSTLAMTEEFLPYIDNWATCDMFSPKVWKKEPEKFYRKTMEWMKKDHEYTIRYGIVSQLKYFLDDKFSPEMLEFMATIQREEYYVNMAIAWYLSMALIKQPEATLPYFQKEKFSPWIHKKALQKAVESARSSQEQKIYFRELKERRNE